MMPDPNLAQCQNLHELYPISMDFSEHKAESCLDGQIDVTTARCITQQQRRAHAYDRLLLAKSAL